MRTDLTLIMTTRAPIGESAEPVEPVRRAVATQFPLRPSSSLHPSTFRITRLTLDPTTA